MILMHCSKCKCALTHETATPTVVHCGGYCRTCKNAYVAERRPKMHGPFRPANWVGLHGPASHKRCSMCARNLPVTAFGTWRANGKYALRSECRECGRPARSDLDQRRRARKRNAQVGPPAQTAAHIRHLRTTPQVCVICGALMPNGAESVDHLVALAVGGAHSVDNLAPAHRSCNSRKGTHALESVVSLTA